MGRGFRCLPPFKNLFCVLNSDQRQAFRLVAAFRATHRPRPQLYSALLTLCGKAGMPQRAKAVWAAIKQASLILLG